MTTIADRFPAAATAKRPLTKSQKDRIGAIQQATIRLAEAIDLVVDEGRDKSLALTHLEDTLMRANRAIATEPEARGVELNDIKSISYRIPATPELVDLLTLDDEGEDA